MGTRPKLGGKHGNQTQAGDKHGNETKAGGYRGVQWQTTYSTIMSSPILGDCGVVSNKQRSWVELPVFCASGNSTLIRGPFLMSEVIIGLRLCGHCHGDEGFCFLSEVGGISARSSFGDFWMTVRFSILSLGFNSSLFCFLGEMSMAVWAAIVVTGFWDVAGTPLVLAQVNTWDFCCGSFL